MTHQVVFNSTNSPNGEILHLASGYVSLTEIAFPNENMTVQIEAKTGDVTFCDAQSNLLLAVKVPVPAVGDQKFSDVQCCVVDEQIRLGFPQYTYKDHYPNCDGESDRWTKTITGFDVLCYDLKNNCIVK